MLRHGCSFDKATPSFSATKRANMAAIVIG
jgi:hypothetical protein